VRKGDTVVVWKLDRLGRNTLHILETVKTLTDRGVTLVSATDGIDSSTAAGRMMIGVLGSLAEYEREVTKERTALKRATSRANGTKFGRPRKVREVQDIATAVVGTPVELIGSQSEFVSEHIPRQVPRDGRDR
jgi:DNA invertase Pin-like site-specific DNA recombinase